MAIVIKKKIDLSHLGEEFKGSYITFKSIAVREYADLEKGVTAIGDDQTKALPFITEQLKSRFIEGEIQGQKVTADDLEDLPGDVFLDCFKQIRGNLDPKE